MLAIRASISLDNSRCFAPPIETGRGPVFKRSSMAVEAGVLITHIEWDHLAGNKAPFLVGASLVANRGM